MDGGGGGGGCAAACSHCPRNETKKVGRSRCIGRSAPFDYFAVVV